MQTASARLRVVALCLTLALAPLAYAEELPILEGPQILTYVEAAYPPELEAAGVEGTVTLSITIDAKGEVDEVVIAKSSGHEAFDVAAVDAVLQMAFAPARTEAGPVAVAFEFNYGFALSVPEVPVEAPINFEGQLRELGTRQPIAGASVVISGTELVATTDAEGRFSLRGVPLGAQQVRLLNVGHVTLEREITFVEGEVSVADLWMRAESYRDNEVVAVYERKKDEVTRRTITMDEVRRIPGTFGDPVKVVQTLPGAARAPFGTGLLVIRGANPEDSGVYVDGIRIPIIYHLTGTTSVLSPDLIASVDYLPGGYGVQFGRTTSGTIDVKTKDVFSEQPKLVWGTDILDSQVYFEGQLGKEGSKHGVAVGARRSYIDAFIPIFTRSSSFILKPRYVDYQAKWVAPTDADKHLSVFFYGFDDVLEVATPADQAQGSDQDTQGDLRTQYASQRIIVRYDRTLNDKLSFKLTPSVGVDYGFFGLGSAFSLSNRNYITNVRAELSWKPSQAVEIVPGLDLLGGFYRFEFGAPFSLSQAEDPLAEREPVGFDGNGSIWSPDLYLRANLRPLGGSDRLLITPGIRANLVEMNTGGSILRGADDAPYRIGSLDPRLASRFAATERTAFKAATGIYHQPPQPQEIIGVYSRPTTTFERAFNTSFGVEQRIGGAAEVEIEGFYRDMTELIVFNDAFGAVQGENPFENIGDGRAYGVEVIARHEPIGRFFGWVSYTLSRSERRDAPDLPWYPFEFDQTHIFSAQGSYKLPRDFGVSLQVQYVTGNPTTLLNASVYDVDGNFHNGFRVGPYNGERLPAFLQSSVRVDKLWTFKSWQLDTYVDLLNAVRGINPEFTLYNYDFTESAYVRGLPFIPNVGLEAKFWL